MSMLWLKEVKSNVYLGPFITPQYYLVSQFLSEEYEPIVNLKIYMQVNIQRWSFRKCILAKYALSSSG